MRHERENSLDMRLFDVFPQQFGLDSSADQLRAFTEDGDRMLLAPRLREKLFFRYPRLMPERLQLPCVYAMTVLFQPLLQQSGERQIHVVAAEQDVIAHRDSAQRQFPVLFRNSD